MIPHRFTLLALLALAIAGSIGFLLIKWKAAEAQVSQVMADKRAVEIDRDKALEANETNLQTIDKLMEEKRLVSESLLKLQADQARNQQVISNISAAIRKQASDPANQVPLSPIIRDTVQAIQDQRNLRAGEAK